MEPQKRLLTLKEVANELRCSKAHVSNVVNGRVRGVARLTSRSAGESWFAANSLDLLRYSSPKKANVDDKVAADQHGHGLGVSLEVYSVSNLQQKIEAVTRLESAVLDAPQSTASSEPPQKTE